MFSKTYFSEMIKSGIVVLAVREKSDVVDADVVLS
jgi:hypothetical protein